ncbi:MAG TPA: Hsp20/alpha crystallin family protein [Kofleriaceae bacterium]|nr:Hsp20/alpha crystallin family protein [Kofleriaceae bacterium]
MSSAKSDGGKEKGELIPYTLDNPFAFMRELFEQFDFAMPRVDIEHQDDQLDIQIDLPGISPEDILITMDEYLLTLEGVRYERRRREEGGVMRGERTFGKFQRVMPLPQRVDPYTAQATFENGVLAIKVCTIGSRPEARKVPISVVGREPEPTD